MSWFRRALGDTWQQRQFKKEFRQLCKIYMGLVSEKAKTEEEAQELKLFIEQFENKWPKVVNYCRSRYNLKKPEQEKQE